MIHFYLIDKIGIGSEFDPFQPNLPLDTPFTCGAYYDQFLVGVTTLITGQTELTYDEALNRAYSVGLDISQWFVKV